MATEDFPLDYKTGVGTFPKSFAYSNTGAFWNEAKQEKKFSEGFVGGDTLGCGLIYYGGVVTKKCFLYFTRNGFMIGSFFKNP